MYKQNVISPNMAVSFTEGDKFSNYGALESEIEQH